jgi:peroxiredoxin
MARKANSKIISFTLSLLLLIALGMACSQSVCPKLNAPAPDFTLADLNGKQVSLSDYLGHNIILTFWATWCGHCKIQLPWMQEVYQKYSSYDLAVIAVNSRESYKQAANYIEEQGYTFTVLLDEKGLVNQEYCVPSLPATILIDSKGIIRYGIPGRFQDKEALEEALSYFQ